MAMHNLSETIAHSLLNIKAVALRPNDPFTWTSGLKSPIYCDNRLTLSYPNIRTLIAEGFAELIRQKYPNAEVIAGTATAGIPHAAWVADKLNLPMIYIRDKAKGHGKQNQIEGVLKEGQKVVVIEDLISTGGSSLKAALAAKEAGGDVQSVLAIFTYEFAQASALFADAGIPVETLTTYSALLDTALAQGYIQEEDLAKLKAWRANPSEYGKAE
ncbi:orotate phosphoribosyltransferase [Gorillibacterium sp. CAU 1737]|uniref:orotate phosphoribosyltransferase n=1 Tax=Gorillibacterium sp. CAU 1737 TaxID=3140362 RepID=UPI003260853D